MATLRSIPLPGVRKRNKVAPPPPPSFQHSLLIKAAPTRVVAAFFDPHALSVWWQTARSVTTPRLFGVYAVEWEPTPFSDEILGPLGGTFFGTVIEYQTTRGFAVADAFWLPPAGEPIGPMALDVSCAMDGPACRLRVRQSGYEDSERWQHYYEVITPGWYTSLAALKHYLEEPPTASEREARRRRKL
jgi:uncharacterized protein YndB with AHSA1/START domain